jgi:hypothetical protein
MDRFLRNPKLHYRVCIQTPAAGFGPCLINALHGPSQHCNTSSHGSRNSGFIPIPSSKINEKVKLFLQQAVEAYRVVETSRILHFLDNGLADDDEVVSLTRRPRFIHKENSWY